jgi:adenylate kinase family enzyme
MSTSTPLGQRIVVIGTTGSGKTTLARQLADHLGCPHIEIDAIHWGPHWTEVPLDQFRAQITQALSADRWTIDGNYKVVRDLVWQRADTIIWLDYALPVIMGRLIKRTLRRVITQEELWNGNRESWRTAVFSRDAILWWALKTYRRRRREFPALLARPEYAGLIVVHLHSPRQTRQWLSEMLQ